MGDPKLFRRILVGVDSTGLATDAVVQGAKLASALGSRLDLIHAVEIPPPLWPGLGKDELATMHAATLADSRAKTIESLTTAFRSAGLELDPEELLSVSTGHASKAILERADEIAADLILLGPHARRSLFDFGSTTRAVLSRTTCAVWHQVEPATPIQRVLVPVDFSDHSHRALELAHALAQRLGASLRVLHCYAAPDFAYSETGDIPGPTYVIDEDRRASREELERWMQEFDWGSVPADSTFAEGMGATRILSEAESADLIVMGTHGRTGLSRFLLGSVAYAVLRQSTKPVLVVPSPNRSWLLGRSDSQEEAEAPPSS